MGPSLLCELCGNASPALRHIAIEGSVLAVCANCRKFGVEVDAPVAKGRTPLNPEVLERLQSRSRRHEERDVLQNVEGDEVLAGDVGLRIRAAREARGWKQAELAAKINEKASVITKLETGGITPSDTLLKKLERALGITLKEKVGKVATRKYSGPSGATLGDIVGLETR